MTEFLWRGHRNVSEVGKTRFLAINYLEIAQIILLSVCVLQLFILVRFGYALAQYGALTLTSGSEELNVYALSKYLHGLPLYESPNRSPFAFTPYNFLFYELYGRILQLFSATHERIYVTGRWITFGFALVGVTIYYLVVTQTLRNRKINLTSLDRLNVICFGFLTFMGQIFVRSWAVTLRPDIAALTVEGAGLFVAFIAIRSNRAATFMLSSLLFAIAFGLKQSSVWIFFSIAAVMCVSAVGRYLTCRMIDWKLVINILTFVSPMVIFIGLSFLFLGGAYRYNVITAQSINQISVTQKLVFDTVINTTASLFLFSFFLFGWRRGEASQMLAQYFQPRAAQPVVIVWAGLVIITLISNVIMATREGSSRNQLFELYLLTSVLSAARFIEVRRDDKAQQGVAGARATILLIPLIAASAVFAFVPNRFGIQIPATQIELTKRQETIRWLSSQPKPLFTTADVLALPWNANDDHYPTFIFNSVFFDRAEELGLLDRSFFRRTIGAAKTAIVLKGDLLVPRLEAAGFNQVEWPSNVQLGFNLSDFVLLRKQGPPEDQILNR